jgi:hypothetical protein
MCHANYIELSLVRISKWEIGRYDNAIRCSVVGIREYGLIYSIGYTHRDEWQVHLISGHTCVFEMKWKFNNYSLIAIYSQ